MVVEQEIEIGLQSSNGATKPRRLTAAARPARPRKSAKTATRSPRRPTAKAIALRAYYLGEARRRENRPGDETQDWLEAERQLVAEAAQKKSRPRRKA
jgi:hypothetical protein